MDVDRSRGLTVERIAMDGDVQLGPRSTPAAATIGSVVYLFGGGHDDYSAGTVTPYADLHAYDTTTNVLSRCTPGGTAPTPRFFAAGAADEAGSCFYVFGGASYGHGFADLVVFGELYRYSVADDDWHLAAPAGQGPGPRVRPNLWFHDGALHSFGGLDANMANHSDLWRYDVGHESWEQVAADDGSVRPRYEAVSGNTSATGNVVALGGEVMGPDFSPRVIPGTIEIDLVSGVITELDLAPSDDVDGGMRHQGGAAEVNGKLHVYGGDDPHTKVIGCGSPYGQSPVGETWVFDPAEQAWRRAAALGPRLKRSVASEVDGRMYVFGGYDFECESGVGPGQIWNTHVVRIDPGP